jgi:hypothetical protein
MDRLVKIVSIDEEFEKGRGKDKQKRKKKYGVGSFFSHMSESAAIDRRREKKEQKNKAQRNIGKKLHH